MTVEELLTSIDQQYAWAFELNNQAPKERSKFWYISQEKLEPRLGNRFEEPGEEYELPFGFGLDMVAMADALRQWPADTKLA